MPKKLNKGKTYITNSKNGKTKLIVGLGVVAIVAIIGIVVVRFSKAAPTNPSDPTALAQQNEIAFQRLQMDRKYYADKGDAGAKESIPQKLTEKEVSKLLSGPSGPGSASFSLPSSASGQADASVNKSLPPQSNRSQVIEKPVSAPPPPGYPALPGGQPGSQSRLVVPAASAYGYYNGASVWWANNSYAQNRFYFGFPDVQWCNWFIMWVASKAGKPIAPYPWTYSGTTASLMNYFGRLRNPGSWSPQQGDLVWFTWSGNKSYSDHIAIVTRVDYGKGGCSIIVMNGNWGAGGNSSTVVAPAQYSCNDWRIISYGDWFGY